MPKTLAHRLLLPDAMQAILWDMDGVLIDSLRFDFDVCQQLLSAHYPENRLSPADIRRNFPYDLPRFWANLVQETTDAAAPPPQIVADLVHEHEQLREATVMPVNDGAAEILAAARQAGLRQAVVSNNPTEQVRQVLEQCGLARHFDQIIGNDLEQTAKKPAPDSYLLAARRLQVEPQRCAVIEDSLLGAEAGHAAGCHVIGVATGAAEWSDLERSDWVRDCYRDFQSNHCRLQVGDVRSKRIQTPNEFVSHMLEHLAWRLGCAIDLQWNNNDWQMLGEMFGAELSRMPRRAETAAAMAMIDDGSAEVRIAAGQAPAVLLSAAAGVDLPWMQSLRCEQMSSGAPLQAMLDGLARACGLRLDALIGSLEDPHHTWEGLFRAIGIALYDMYVSAEDAGDAMNGGGSQDAGGDAPRQPAADSGWAIEFEQPDVVTATRTTAESRVRVRVDSRGFRPTVWKAEVSDSIRVEGFAALLDAFAREANVALDVEFAAIKLSSSHVVTEDTGLVLGRALKEIMIRRMHRQGINGAGSNMSVAADAAGVRVALSFEGRNSLLIVPIHSTLQQLRSSLIVGHTVGDGLFSEDLDDFFYGVAWGMSANIVVHVHQAPEVDSAWQEMFAGLGAAWRQSSLPNPMRRGVPPGVKATLA